MLIFYSNTLNDHKVIHPQLPGLPLAQQLAVALVDGTAEDGARRGATLETSNSPIGFPNLNWLEYSLVNS